MRALFRVAVCIAALPVVVAGCGGERRTVTIGFAFSAANAGVVRAAREALAEQSGGPLIRIVFDSIGNSVAADAEVARAQAMLAVPGLAGVVGHYGSRGSLVAAPLYNRAEVPQIVPTGTSRLLPLAGPWTFTLAPDEHREGEFIARFASDSLRAARVTLFYLNNEYGRGLREVLAAEFRRRSVAVIDEVPFDRASRFDVLVEASLARGRPDAMIVAGEPFEGVRIVRLAAARARGLRFVLADGAFRPALVADSAPAAADSVYGVTFWQADSSEALDRAFVARYTRITGQAPVHLTALTYDALLLLAAAVRAEGPRPAGVRRYLASLGRGRPPFEGVSGLITFLPERRAPLYMVRVRDRAVVVAEGS